MDTNQAIAAIGQRLAYDGQRVSTEQLPGAPAVVGYRSDFRMQWLATKLHLFTVVLAQPVVTGDALARFSQDALELAVRLRGGARGFQSGVAAIPIMVGAEVDHTAVAYARDQIVKRFAAFAWPAAQNSVTGVYHRHEGTVVLGGVYASWMRHQTSVAFGF